MRSALLRLLTATAVSAAVAVGLVGPGSASAATTMTATTAVNVRSGPSSGAKIVGGLHRGQTVSALSSAKGWTIIRYKSLTAYVATSYLAKGTSLPSANLVGLGTVKTTTTEVNLRRGPSLSDPIITVLKQGTRVTLTGTTAKGYSEATAGKSTGWISSQYLTAATTGLPTITGSRVATATLAIRTASGNDATVVGEIKKGTKVAVTGATANGRAQIVLAGAVRWVTAKYLSNPSSIQPTAPALPKVIGTRYATANLLIRSNSSATFTTIGEIPRGTKISITGVVKNARMQIIWDGAARWVTAKYLATKKPAATTSVVEKGLKPNAILVLRGIQESFPQIKTIYGVRKDALPDHPSGRALDLMVPGYKTAAGKALGTNMAGWLKTNNKRLGVNYLIWNQKIWNVRRDSAGWRTMATRGGDSADHKNHVHVTVFAAGLPPI